MARKRKKTSHRSPAARRAGWSGQLTFGLVSFPVEAINAIDREQSDIHFHQIHAKCHRRIRYQKTCPVHGEVGKEEIVSGYEHKKGQYVEFEPEELSALKKESDRALKIEAFVPPDAIDPIYFDGRMYYLVPAEAAAAEPYAVLRMAMEEKERCALGQVIFSGKEQLVLVRPLEGVLHMALLNYEAEIRPPASVKAGFHEPANIARQVKLAQTLVAEWSEERVNFGKFKDTYREQVADLIAAKVKGRKVVAAKDDEEPPRILNLVEALKKSMRTKRAVRRSA